MSFEEEFDRIIRRKAEAEKYPFDENNWGKVNQLLDAERKAARALKFKQLYLPAAIVITLGSIGLFTFNHLNKENKKDLTTLVAATTSTKNTNTEAKLNPAALKNEQDFDAHTSTKNSVELKRVPGSIEQEPETNIQKNIPPSEQVGDVSQVVVANSDANPLETEKEPVKSLNPGGTILEQQVINNPVVQETISANEDATDNTVVKSSASMINSENANTTTENNNELALNASQVLENQKTEELVAEQLKAVYSALPFEMSNDELLQTPFVSLSRYDDDYYKPGKSKTHYLTAELGGNYLFGWDAKKGKDGVGLNWFGGFNYGRYLTDKMSISIGLQAYNISNIKQPFYLVSNKVYDFGSTDVYTRVSSNQLYYVSVPLKFNYALNNANTIGFGVNAGYLVRAENSVAKYYVLDNEEKMVKPVSTNNEIYKGTSMTNVILSAHYRTKLSDRFALNAEFNYGLTDIFKNMGDIKNSEKPVGVRVSINYTLFDK